jgi:hypothetical protein
MEEPPAVSRGDVGEHQMPTVHTRYVTWISRGVRGHGSAAADITTALSTGTLPGLTYQAYAPPSMTWSDAAGSHSGVFAFWSITGAANGASTSINASAAVTAGGSDIYVTAWYIPEGSGGGPGSPGLFVDAFDVGLGTFVDDDFVDIVSDPSLTASANQTGFVPTASTEDVRAYTEIHNVPFSAWTEVTGTESVTGRDINAIRSTDAILFAFFQAPASSSSGKLPHTFGSYEIYNWVSYGVMVDGGGPTGNGPVPPWNPDIRELLAGITLAETANIVGASLRTSVLRIAAAQVATAAGSIARLMEEQAVAQKISHAREPELAVH